MKPARITIAAVLLAALSPLARAGQTDLQNNRRLRLMGTQGSSQVYRIYVPEYQNRLEITTSGGRGDLDLFVRWGRQPQPQNAQYRSVGRDTNERISVHNPRSGWWYVLVTAYRSYVGAEMHVRYWGNDGGVITHPGGDWDYDKPGDDDTDQSSDRVLLDGRSLTGLSGYARSERVFRIDVPAGTEKLTITSQGHLGDPDLYLRRGLTPQRNRYDAKSIASGPDERLVYDNPPAGTWYLLVYGYRAYSHLSLRLDLDRGVDNDWPGHGRPRPGRSGVILTNPTGDEVWYLGHNPVVRWRAIGRARLTRVQVQYSLDDGRTWQRGGNMPQAISAATEALQVNLPATATRFLTDRARVRIVDVDRREVVAISERFSVRRRRGRGRPGLPDLPGRRPGHRDRREILPDSFENDNNFKRPSFIRLNTIQNRTIHDEDEVDHIRFGVSRAGSYRISIESLEGFEIQGELHVRRKNHPETRIGRFEIDGDERKHLVVNADSKTYWYTLTVRAEDDDERGAYRVIIREN
jgi:hypothetical protein